MATLSFAALFLRRLQPCAQKLQSSETLSVLLILLYTGVLVAVQSRFGLLTIGDADKCQQDYFKARSS
jgi:hypothetical protein